MPAVDVMKIFEKASDDRLGLPSALQAVLASLTCSCMTASVPSAVVDQPDSNNHLESVSQHSHTNVQKPSDEAGAAGRLHGRAHRCGKEHQAVVHHGVGPPNE